MKKALFKPQFNLSPKLLTTLTELERVKGNIEALPMTTTMMKSLRETARIQSTHYSTMIEGNRLTEKEVALLDANPDRSFGKERDEKEALGYLNAFDEVKKLAKRKEMFSETDVKKIHALVMAGNKKNVKPTPYRDGQNVIREGSSRRIVYLPPEAHDVKPLMRQLLAWLDTAQETVAAPLQAGIAHYQFATIHPYYDGNGRTARLLATLILHRAGYGLKDFYALEEYYARNLADYYQALTVGPSHNYYEGRAEADITPWLEYFCDGMLHSFKAVQKRALQEADRGKQDESPLLRNLDVRQSRTIELFTNIKIVNSAAVAEKLGINKKVASLLCQTWVASGFFEIANPSKKNRLYRLNPELDTLLFGPKK